jgi:hypothetical protein
VQNRSRICVQKTTLLAIFGIVTAIALITADSITTSTLAVKKKSTITTKKSTGSKKTKKALKPVREAVQQQQQV